MKRILLLFTILIVFGSCDSNITPDGREIEETINIRNFISLEVSSGIDIEFVHSDEETAVIETHEDVLPYVKVTNMGTSLSVSLDKNCPFDHIPSLKIRINSPELAIVKATGASQVKVLTDIISDYFEIHLYNGSVFSMEENKSITTKSLLINLENGSKSTVEGSSELLITDINGGSFLYGLGLNTEEVEAELNMRSLLEISVSKKYEFIAKGASTIRYKGNAKGTFEADGGSKIESL